MRNRLLAIISALKMQAWAGENGVDAVKLGQCVDTKATEPEVNRSIAEGHALRHMWTPTLFINGREISLAWPDLQLVINEELELRQPVPKKSSE